MQGKSIRMERIFNRNTGKAVIVPMDHGLTVGPIKGIKSVKAIAEAIASGGADAAIVHKGAVIFGHRGYGRDLGLIIHLSASTILSPDPNNKVLVANSRGGPEARSRWSKRARQYRSRGRGQYAIYYWRDLSKVPGVGHASVGHDVSAWKEDQR